MFKKIISIFIMAIGICTISAAAAFADSEFVVRDGRVISYTGNSSNVVIPAEIDGEPIITISRFAFNNLDTLEAVVLSDGIEIIESEAFKNCYNLKSVDIPESLMLISSYSFSGCYHLNPVTPKSDQTLIDEDAYTDADMNKNFLLFNIDDYTVENGIITQYSGTDTDITIPDTIDGVTITGIGTSAFQGNETIESVTMPDTIKTLGEQCFYSCTNLKSLKLSNNLSSCGKNAFAYCTSLTEVEIPGTLKIMGNSMFYGCSELKKAIINEGVTNTNTNTFYNCPALTEVSFPSTIKTLGVYSLAFCTSMEAITIPYGTTTLGSAAFYGCRSLKSIYIPDSVTQIITHCFRGCKKLASVRMSPNVTMIQYRCFDGCAFTEFEVPEKVTAIGGEAFYNCLRLNNIIMYGNISLFETGIFDYSVVPNRNLTIYTPEGVKAEAYAKENNISYKTIVKANAPIAQNNSIGVYGTINYPLTENIAELGTLYIPEQLMDDPDAEVLDISYPNIEVPSGSTFMTVITEVPEEAKSWTYVATPYLKLLSGQTIKGKSKSFNVINAVMNTVEEEK